MLSTLLQYLFLGLIVVSGCTTASSRASDAASVPADVDRVLTGNDNIKTNPSSYIGKRVLVSGEVKSILSPTALVLDYGGGLFGIGDKQILVVRENQTAGVSISLGTRVETIGVIRLFNLIQMERELGVDLDDNAFKGYQNAPVLIARTILNRP